MTSSDIAATAHAAATNLLALVAAAETSIHAVEVASPLVASAISLAVNQGQAYSVPVSALASLGGAVLGLAQVIATVTAAATVAK